MPTFNNKVIFITGASSGLGEASVKLFIEKGATVFGVARNTEKLKQLQQQYPDNFHYHTADIANVQACQEAIQTCVQHCGQLDVLINVAGKHVFRHSTEVTTADWQQDMAVNLNAPFFLAQAALPHLLESHGNIINVASIAGLSGQPYSATYCAAKHGVIGLTRALALEFMQHPIRVNAICPGGMDTPQVQNIQPPENCDFDLLMRSAAPRGFMQAEDVAKVLVFLASDDAKAIHGAVYEVDNGKLVG